MTAVVKNIISRLVFPFQIIDKFSLWTFLKILEQKKVKGSASKANKDCQILLFDVHVVHRTPKVSFPRRISEDDGKQAVSTLHSNVQLLFSLIKAIVLCRSRCRCRPRILKSLITTLSTANLLLSFLFSSSFLAITFAIRLSSS